MFPVWFVCVSVADPESQFLVAKDFVIFVISMHIFSYEYLVVCQVT